MSDGEYGWWFVHPRPQPQGSTKKWPKRPEPGKRLTVTLRPGPVPCILGSCGPLKRVFWRMAVLFFDMADPDFQLLQIRLQ